MTSDALLAAARRVLGRDRGASLDQVARAAGMSRTTVYRRFGSRDGLLRALVESYSPLEAVRATVERLGDRPPEEVMPEIARTAARTLAGRVGIVRTLVFEVTSASAESGEAAGQVVLPMVTTVARYLTEQMAAGRLRPMHPLLAVQSFAGPLLLHLITRGLAERMLTVDLPLEEAVTELARSWVQGMRPGERAG